MPTARTVFHLHRDMELGFGFAQAVHLPPELYVSGATALAGDLTVRARGDFAAQLDVVYSQLRATLEAFGYTFAHVVKEVMYTTDMDALLATNERRKAFFAPGHLPAATAVQVERLAVPGLLLEVELIARSDLDVHAPVVVRDARP